MAPVLPAGPYEQIDLGNGNKAPLYVVPFDKEGICTGPQTRKALVEAAKSGGFTDVFVFSHGWNNDWPAATGRYRDFFATFRQVREAHGGLPAGYKPLLVGVFWPSTALVFGEEKGPQLAGGPIATGPDDSAGSALGESIDEIAGRLEPAARARFYELATAAELTSAEARELAALLLPLYQSGADPEEGDSDLEAADLVALWRQLPDEAEAEEKEAVKKPGMVGVGGVAAPAGPQAAGFLGTLVGFPRQAVRAFTVWQMKDRAGVVGARGMAPLLRELLAAAPAEFHLIGHSYGCKLLLSAICDGPPLADGAVASLLLLEPAINFWCFARDVDGEGFPGGYRDAFRAVRQPILQTYSKHDIPLRRIFHLAVTRRKEDLGEAKVAGLIEPDRYGALGGWGPKGCTAEEYRSLDLPKAGEAYPDLAAELPQIYGLNGGDNDTITGHGDVTTPHTAWALLQQVRVRP